MPLRRSIRRQAQAQRAKSFVALPPQSTEPEYCLEQLFPIPCSWKACKFPHFTAEWTRLGKVTHLLTLLEGAGFQAAEKLDPEGDGGFNLA
jgi:hypothetical protein